MADKNPVKEKSAEPKQSELDTLRHIVFGAAKADLDKHLSELEKAMQTSFKKAEQEFDKRMKQIQANLDDGLQQLDAKLAQIDQQHEEKEAELTAYADKLSSELEMSDATGRQENDELHNRMDKEVTRLTEKYDAKFAEALKKLSEVTTELNTSKTDRKTLAKLLATMATNLETDED